VAVCSDHSATWAGLLNIGKITVSFSLVVQWLLKGTAAAADFAGQMIFLMLASINILKILVSKNKS